MTRQIFALLLMIFGASGMALCAFTFVVVFIAMLKDVFR